jgi:hypothetical protein
MAQIFHPSVNTIAKASIFGGVFVLMAVGWMTDQGLHREQPVPFSHEHHVRGLGIDCRYCHGSVEDSHFAGIPPTKTCMTCHSKIWTDAELLEPVRESWRTNTPIQWQRVHNLPHFAYFNHSMHVNKGIGCTTCHGQVDTMPLMYQNASLQMQWCLNCHRQPEAFVRPRDKVYDTTYEPADQADLGPKLVAEYHIPTDGRLTNCSTCHR